VALRVPGHPAALRLLKTCGLPLAAPSANRSLQVSPTTAAHVQAGLPEVPLILDGGPCPFGIESTVVDLTTTPPRLLRPGALALRLLREALPELELPLPEHHPLAFTLATGKQARPAPGMLARHYAPRARLVLLPALRMEQALLLLPPPRGLLSHLGRPDAKALVPHCSAVETLPADAAGYAADLYAALHRLDDRGVKSIGVVPTPKDLSGDWYAIADRLSRASQEPTP
jgi:L-threonylcarbamoyladenylate synthase